jgi:hypothetical protein
MRATGVKRGDEQFVDAWMPQGQEGGYPARVSVSRNVANDRQVITILELVP